MHKSKTNNELNSEYLAKEPQPIYGFVSKSPEEKLLHLVYRSDMEKLQAFTKMLRRNATLKKGVVSYPKEK